jgi:hypothetical protein
MEIVDAKQNLGVIVILLDLPLLLGVLMSLAI